MDLYEEDREDRLISLEDYDARLFMIATERMAHYDPSKLILLEEIDSKYGFTKEDLQDADEVEFEGCGK